MKRPRYQFGSLYTESRKSGPDVWVYRWRETDQQGNRQPGADKRPSPGSKELTFTDDNCLTPPVIC
jgi:hypothetical protein